MEDVAVRLDGSQVLGIAIARIGAQVLVVPA